MADERAGAETMVIDAGATTIAIEADAPADARLVERVRRLVAEYYRLHPESGDPARR